MEINNDLILQWERKIQKMSSNTFIVGMEREDIAQELRIAIIKAAKAYDNSRGILFHTYLHTTLVNTIRTLISKAQKQPELKSLDTTYVGSSLLSSEIIEALKDPSNYESSIEVDNWLDSKDLTSNELLFIQLRLEGLTMDEITEDLKACKKCRYCLGYWKPIESSLITSNIKVEFIGSDYKQCLNKNSDSSYKVRQTLREKFINLNDG